LGDIDGEITVGNQPGRCRRRIGYRDLPVDGGVVAAGVAHGVGQGVNADGIDVDDAGDVDVGRCQSRVEVVGDGDAQQRIEQVAEFDDVSADAGDDRCGDIRRSFGEFGDDDVIEVDGRRHARGADASEEESELAGRHRRIGDEEVECIRDPLGRQIDGLGHIFQIAVARVFKRHDHRSRQVGFRTERQLVDLAVFDRTAGLGELIGIGDVADRSDDIIENAVNDFDRAGATVTGPMSPRKFEDFGEITVDDVEAGDFRCFHAQFDVDGRRVSGRIMHCVGNGVVTDDV